LLILHPEIKKYFPATSAGFDQIMNLKGEIYRALEGRRTQRIILGEHIYFIKQHQGIGWKEIIKNIFQLRAPVLSAKNEWLALKKLKEFNIPVPEVVGYGCRGVNPATLRSFIITREISQSSSLEELVKTWKQRPLAFSDKLKLIKEVARIAFSLHSNGINHRDFYICHFLLDLSASVNAGPKLYLIDLHRAGLRKRTPRRWIVKDLAGLYFSSHHIGLTSRDLLRFIKAYHGNSLRDMMNKEKLFWLKVKKRGEKLCRKHS
jgi:heptose I phosphotransferase